MGRDFRYFWSNYIRVSRNYGFGINTAGFGLTENILYGLNALVFGGLLATVLLVIIRSNLEIVGHPFFTGWIGSEVGLEKKCMVMGDLERDIYLQWFFMPCGIA